MVVRHRSGAEPGKTAPRKRRRPPSGGRRTAGCCWRQ
uniref:Orc3 n=1 Tax=Arundo donax TaxID=35708 RepID=A0A0A8ZPB2_ARUDO